ncbi:protein MLP1 homolog isoform X2 [Cajanus cajan]|uniref:protein MLP1 homolog isoform X2 n=1 Tax=Cajanus cajan TaxID=3821 RepID=UPI00098DADF4|nr:protein MLP1 homolog isoform X2 [Cajanus cajan]
MLEKIGLPPKPSLRGNNWVVDASHCQGCTSQFTFINRKHHCRRCGGIFCGKCTQQRMVLRGQGDSPVRICEPCKKLEEAARFELRHGRRPGRGSLKSTPRDEDEVLNQILGQTSDKVPSRQRSVGVASSSSTSDFDGDIQNVVSDDKPNVSGVDLGSTTPDELRQQALEEKKKHKILKGEGKSEEALRAFKRGKELERQADALEIHLRKTRKKSLPSGNLSDVHNRGVPLESDRKTKSLSHVGRENDDLTSELRELGWSDMDLHNEDKKSSKLSVEGELSSIIGEIFTKSGEQKGSKIDKSQVVALKKNALMLKREGKLAEAKEELKRAKILEKELEEQELLAEGEDSDDELSALIRGMDDDKGFSDLHDHGHGFDFERLLAVSDDLDGNFEVTDDDMMDPEIAVALESLGWTEPENTSSKSQTLDKEELLSEIQSLKREALNQKRAGNTEEAMAFLKKAKLLERSLNSSGPEDYNSLSQKSSAVRKIVSSEISGNGSDSIQLDDTNTSATNNVASTVAPKSRLMIQRELLSLKKKALTLRREGKMNEAEEEMQKGAALERQLMEMDKASNLKASQKNTADNVPHTTHKHADFSRDVPLEEGNEDDVTDQDMTDPTYISLLSDLGWTDDNNELSNSPSKPLKKDDNHVVPVKDASLSRHSTNILVQAPRSKVEIQRELLGLKRKALAFRREGKTEDAEEVLQIAKELEDQMAGMEAANDKAQVEATVMKGGLFNPPVDEERDAVVSEEDMHDPVLNSMLTNLGWKDDESEPVTIKEEPVKEATGRSKNTVDLSSLDFSSGTPATALRSKVEIQRELLVLKRKALAFRRNGEIEEAEEILRKAKSLEAQIEDFGTQSKDLSLKVSKDESSDFQERHGSLEAASAVDNASASSVVWSNGKHSLSADGSTSSENLSKKMKAEKSIGRSSSSDHAMDMLDLPTGNSSEISTQKHKEYKLGLANSSQAGPAIHLDSSVNFHQDQEYINSNTTQKRDVADAIEKPNMKESNAVQDYASQRHLTLRQDILAHKRKAVTLKREGKLAEAKEELRQAKLLEKGLEDESMQPDTASASNVSHASNVVQKKQESSNVSAKPLSSRDRFKLQQESLGHKRQALKLRRDGRIEEAEAEFERAKEIETQLEELTAQDSSKSDGVDDVSVEDFLDPQLLSALKAVGIDNARVVSKSPERQEAAKSNAKVENSNQERIQLEERIKEEKVKALNLKRSGKQAEALDALRRAKLYEKKLNSLTSD